MLQTSESFLTMLLSVLYFFLFFYHCSQTLRSPIMLAQTVQAPMRGRTSFVPFMYFVGEGENQSEKFKCLKVSGQLPNFSSSTLCYRDPSSKLALKLLPEYSQAPPWLCSAGTHMLSTNRVPGGLQPFLPIRSG